MAVISRPAAGQLLILAFLLTPKGFTTPMSRANQFPIFEFFEFSVVKLGYRFWLGP